MATFDVMVKGSGGWRFVGTERTVRSAQDLANLYRSIGYDTIYIHGHWTAV